MRFASLLVALGSLAAQTAQPPAAPFAGVKALSCSFPVYATANLAGTPPQPGAQKQEFTFTLDSFDFKKMRARFVGSSGAAVPVSLLSSQIGITVIEQTVIGNVNMTTVFAAGGHDQVRLAVHSRHIGDPTELPSVSQSYGSCEIEK
jgi:hypothetical protein